MNSLYSWAARVLLGARIRAGRWVCSMTLAMVKVLPEPVTPSSTWSRSPSAAWATSSAMAAGWSPAGVYFVSSRKGRETLSVGREGRCGTQSAGAPGASSGVRRGPVTGANMGMEPGAAEAPLKAAGASDTPEAERDDRGERAMNGKVVRRGPCG